jgi:hypothetical protein
MECGYLNKVVWTKDFRMDASGIRRCINKCLDIVQLNRYVGQRVFICHLLPKGPVECCIRYADR